MKKYFKTFVFFGIIICLSSCASLSGSPASFVRDGISLNFKSDPHLNEYMGESHTLFVCVYQLRDPNIFNQMIDEEEGLSKLLECSRFDSSIASSKSYVIQPGKNLEKSMDRAEGARYVGIIAGYSLFQKENQKEKMTRLFPIPYFLPMPMKVDLYLGPQTIQEVKVR